MRSEHDIKRRILLRMAEALIFDLNELPKPLDEHSDSELEALVDQARSEPDDNWHEDR